MQIKEVKVCFEENGKPYSFDCGRVFVNVGDKVVVDTSRGLEIGTICSKVSYVDVEGENPYKKIIRIATEEDLNAKTENVKKEQEIKIECEKIAEELNLDMKIVGAELNLDASKVVVYFTSDDRVDFREMVKMLAGKFKMRIELKQIDAREETKIIGGLGPCGRECCCSTFLKDAEHSSIKMAKVQGLSLNPSNISGLCGKLKCCLCYENEYYAETFKLMPKLNTEVTTPDGKGLVIYNNLLKRTVSVKFKNPDESTTIREYELKQIKLEDKNAK